MPEGIAGSSSFNVRGLGPLPGYNTTIPQGYQMNALQGMDSGAGYNPLTGQRMESLWSQNFAAMNNLLRTPPQYIRNNAFTPPALPNTTMTGMTGGFSGAMPVGMGGGVPSQAPIQRTRVYGPSFGLPNYTGRNS